MTLGNNQSLLVLIIIVVIVLVETRNDSVECHRLIRCFD